jgi:hypothetical protein
VAVQIIDRPKTSRGETPAYFAPTLVTKKRKFYANDTFCKIVQADDNKLKGKNRKMIPGLRNSSTIN